MEYYLCFYLLAVMSLKAFYTCSRYMSVIYDISNQCYLLIRTPYDRVALFSKYLYSNQEEA